MFKATDALSVRAFFPGEAHGLLLESAGDENTTTSQWASKRGAVLWDAANFVLYVNLETVDGESKVCLRNTVRAAILETLDKHRWYGITLQCTENGQSEDVSKSLAAVRTRPDTRRHYRHDCASISNDLCPPSGYDISLVDRDFLDKDHLRNIEDLKFEILKMWPGTERYLERGFAYAAHDGMEIAAFCTSEFVSRAKCGMGVWTSEAYRRKGLATGCCRMFVRHACEAGIVPYWECSPENEASNGLAKKLGFTVAEESPVLEVRLK